MIFIISRFVSFFIKKDASLLLICIKKAITENHKAFFNYLYHNSKNTEFKIIVLSRMPMPKSYYYLTHYKTFSLKGWIAFMRSKKILISHGEWDYKPFTKLSYQNIINMWHGTPLKKLGIGSLNTFPFLTNSNKKIPWYFHIVSSDYEKKIMMSTFFLREEQVKILGVPKNDTLFSTAPKKNKKQILYLNTFRTKGFSKFFWFKNRNLNEIDEQLMKNDIQIIFKLHPNEENNPNIQELLNFSQFKIADQSFNIQKELRQSLGLITDYSGVVFDALGIDIPVILLPYDLEEYSKTNGFNRKYEDFLPNSQAFDQIKFIELLKNIINGKQIVGQEVEKYRYYKYLDENSSFRLIKFIESLN